MEALPAASVLVLREAPLEVLMIRRHAQSSFVPNAWVFPGGMVDESDRAIGDGSTLGAMRVAAVRELFEEAGVWLGRELEEAERKRHELLGGTIRFDQLLAESPVDFTQLVWTSHWITPVAIPKRFDTWFFLVRAPEGATATAEHNEAVEVTWIAPEEALRRNRSGAFEMVFPTIKNLEAICGFGSVKALMDSRRDVKIESVLPLLVDEDGRKKIVLP